MVNHFPVRALIYEQSEEELKITNHERRFFDQSKRAAETKIMNIDEKITLSAIYQLK